MSISGHCNQCGNCCWIGNFKCQYLDIGGIAGMPMSTRCTVYDKRYTDMPILLADPYGSIKEGFCLHNAGKPEDDALVALIRRGQCSMTIE